MITTRKATPDDLEQLLKLFNDYRAFYGMVSDEKGARVFLAERLERQESVVFVALDEDSTMLGFVQLYPLFSSTRMKPLWLLNDLFVAVAARGKGVSVSLIDMAKQLCVDTSACGLLLETAKDNSVANQLYIKTEFQKDDVHNYYSWDAPQPAHQTSEHV